MVFYFIFCLERNINNNLVFSKGSGFIRIIEYLKKRRGLKLVRLENWEEFND